MPWLLDKVVISLIGMKMGRLHGKSDNQANQAESGITCSGISQGKSRNNRMKGN